MLVSKYVATVRWSVTASGATDSTRPIAGGSQRGFRQVSRQLAGEWVIGVEEPL